MVRLEVVSAGRHDVGDGVTVFLHYARCGGSGAERSFSLRSSCVGLPDVTSGHDHVDGERAAWIVVVQLLRTLLVWSSILAVPLQLEPQSGSRHPEASLKALVYGDQADPYVCL